LARCASCGRLRFIGIGLGFLELGRELLAQGDMRLGAIVPDAESAHRAKGCTLKPGKHLKIVRTYGNACEKDSAGVL
jgi:hypothetical protein